MHTPAELVRSVLEWPVRTQQRSRRNALVASTALAQRRRERHEVEQFLQARAEPLPTPSGARTLPAAATRSVI